MLYSVGDLSFIKFLYKYFAWVRKQNKNIKQLIFINGLYSSDIQHIAKKLQKTLKKSAKKENNVLKKYLPLQRFNKQ